MTTQERATALEAAGFTPRQAQFLGLAALVSGACCRRHYETFAGIRPGKNTRAWLDALVARGWANRRQFRRDRALVYQLAGKELYRTLGETDNRHRRPSTPAALARRLMLLDAVLARPTLRWYATEQDKVAYFDALGIEANRLPRRRYLPTKGARTTGVTVRQFIDKLPIGEAPETGALTFLYLAVNPTAQRFERFLNDHAPLLTRLPRWDVCVVYPPSVRTAGTHQTVFDRWYRDLPRPVTRAEFAWAIAAHRQLAAGARTLAMDDMHRLQDLIAAVGRRAFASACDDANATATASGDTALPGHSFAGSLSAHRITHPYDLFGSQPGLA